MANNGGKKYELIEAAYQLLKTHSPDELTIRMIAKKAQCASTVIYRHFDNLDHLLLIASIRFLQNYIVAVGKLLEKEADPYFTLMQMWHDFGEQAFQNVEVFELLFWGRFNKQLADGITQYYQLFPDEWRKFNGIITTIFFSSNVYERNAIMVKRAAAAGYFSHKEIDLLSDMQVYLFHGMLLEYRDIYRHPGKAKEGLDNFMDMLHSLTGHYRLK